MRSDSGNRDVCGNRGDDSSRNEHTTWAVSGHIKLRVDEGHHDLHNQPTKGSDGFPNYLSDDRPNGNNFSHRLDKVKNFL